jgi:hypothetical protein
MLNETIATVSGFDVIIENDDNDLREGETILSIQED